MAFMYGRDDVGSAPPPRHLERDAKPRVSSGKVKWSLQRRERPDGGDDLVECQDGQCKVVGSSGDWRRTEDISKGESSDTVLLKRAVAFDPVIGELLRFVEHPDQQMAFWARDQLEVRRLLWVGKVAAARDFAESRQVRPL